MKEASVEQLLVTALKREEAEAPPPPAVGWLQSLNHLRVVETETESQAINLSKDSDSDHIPSITP